MTATVTGATKHLRLIVKTLSHDHGVNLPKLTTLKKFKEGRRVEEFNNRFYSSNPLSFLRLQPTIRGLTRVTSDLRKTFEFCPKCPEGVNCHSSRAVQMGHNREVPGKRRKGEEFRAGIEVEMYQGEGGGGC